VPAPNPPRLERWPWLRQLLFQQRSGLFGVNQAIADELELYPEQHQLTEGNKHQERRKDGQYPSGLREPNLVISMLLFIVSIGLSLLGGDNLYRKRLLFGAALICGGWLLSCWGIFGWLF
jgi:hypothetical protein